MRCNVFIDLVRDGSVIEYQMVSNFVTVVGLNILRDCWAVSNPRAMRTSYPPTFMALGTGSTAATIADTELETFTVGTSLVINNRSSTDKRATYQGYWDTSIANGSTYSEAGLFDGSLSTDGLFARIVFSPIVKTESVDLIITWDVDFTAS
jgi:hypothetical protein